MTTPVEETGTPWEIDDAEIVQRILQTGVDAIEGITEAFQNAVDSVLPPFEESTDMRLPYRFHRKKKEKKTR
jgi:hypothetical protein